MDSLFQINISYFIVHRLLLASHRAKVHLLGGGGLLFQLCQYIALIATF